MTRFDPFQKFEGVDDFLASIPAGFVIAQGGFGPLGGLEWWVVTNPIR